MNSNHIKNSLENLIKEHNCTIEDIKICLNEFKPTLNELELKNQAWLSIYENESLKRAIEIAIAGNHKITVIGNPENGLNHLKIILGNLLTFIKNCPCGNFQDVKQICNCSSSIILKYRQSAKYRQALNNPIISRLYTPKNWNNSQENLIDVMKRIDNISKRIIIDIINTKTINFFKVYQQKFNPTSLKIDNIFNIVKTIAKFDDGDQIEPHHMAEAIQYQIIS